MNITVLIFKDIHDQLISIMQVDSILLANCAQLSPESIRHTLIFITLLSHQTYSIKNTSIALSYVTGNKNSQGMFCRKSASNILTN